MAPRRKKRADADDDISVERSTPLKLIEDADRNAEDDDIIEDAYDKYTYASDWESDFLNLAIQDTKFANADSDNGWQWPEDMRRDRMINRRPALTINKTQTHVLLCNNEAIQNQAEIVIKPDGEESSYQAAQALEGLVRNIQYRSVAQAIYNDAGLSQLECGIGYFRIVSMFPDANSFDQELRLMPVDNQMNVLLDPDIKQKNGSDANFGIIFWDMPNAMFRRKYKFQPPTGSTPFANGQDWVRPDHIRVCEFYRIVTKMDELIYMKDKAGHETLFRKSELDKMDVNVRRAFKAAEKEKDPDVVIRKRPVEDRRLEWYMIGGHQILDRITDYKTQYIPIVRFVGRERVIDGKLERKGIVRPLKDPQRMYNYNSSAQAEYGAGATKSPWIVALAGIAGNETVWNRANVDNKPYLPYKHKDNDGAPIPPPQRPEPPGTSPAFITGMEIAAREFEMASGQGPAQFGKPQREISGIAIGKTQRQGETITYDFIENRTLGIQYAGMILLDWIPYVYDTKRITQILDKDGTETQLQIDPAAEAPYAEAPDQNNDKGKDNNVAVFNPKVGRYKVQARSGPAYATQREDAWNAFVQIVTGSPALIDEIGDLMFQAADFPMADKISERIKRKIRATMPWLLDDEAPTPALQQAQQQIQQATQQIGELLQQLAEKDRKLRDQAQDIAIKAAKVSNEYRSTDIQAYDAHSKRITAVSNAEPELNKTGDMEGLKTLIRQMLVEANGDTANQDARLPVPGTQQPDHDEDQDEDFHEPRKAPDGNHYVKIAGKYHRVDEQHMAELAQMGS